MTAFDWVRVVGVEDELILRMDQITGIVVKLGINRVADIEIITADPTYPKVSIARVSPEGKDDYPRHGEATLEVARGAVKQLLQVSSQPAGLVWTWNNAELEFQGE